MGEVVAKLPVRSLPITKEQLLTGTHKLYLKLLLNGGFGVGKTYCAMTFPKWAYGMVEPHGIQTAKVPANKSLLDNMVYYESFVPRNDEDIKDTFERYKQFLIQARKDAETGKIETVIIDNLSHLSENRWIYIEKYEAVVTSSGKTDTRSMFMPLSRWLYRMTVRELLTIPAHVVMTCHIMDEQKEDEKGKVVETGRILSNTLGGFRKDAGGLFNASLFLDCYKSGAIFKYRARCLPGQGRDAKNNLGLPEFVENISYQTIQAVLHGQVVTS